VTGRDTRERDGLLPLAVRDTLARYREGIHPPGKGETVMYRADGEMGHLSIEECELLPAERGNS
jgi:hypothetical protein